MTGFTKRGCSVSVEFSIDFQEIEEFNDLEEEVKDLVIEAYTADYGEGEDDVYNEFERLLYAGFTGNPHDALRAILRKRLSHYIFIAQRKYEEEQEAKEAEEDSSDEE